MKPLLLKFKKRFKDYYYRVMILSLFSPNKPALKAEQTETFIHVLYVKLGCYELY